MSRLKGAAAVMAMAVALVGAWEGMRTVAYRDPVGIPTVCFGETRGVKMGDRYTVEQCKEMLGDGLIEFETMMRRCLKAPDRIPDKSYVSFLSLTYNIGPGAWCKSSIRTYANKYADTGNLGHLANACNRILRYNKAGGRVLRGLVNRRKDERRLCLEGVREKTVTGLGDDV